MSKPDQHSTALPIYSLGLLSNWSLIAIGLFLAKFGLIWILREICNYWVGRESVSNGEDWVSLSTLGHTGFGVASWLTNRLVQVFRKSLELLELVILWLGQFMKDFLKL